MKIMRQDGKLYKAIKDKWVAALRSGKYKKGTGQLRHVLDDGDDTYAAYCCLGVLATELGLYEKHKIGAYAAFLPDLLPEYIQKTLACMNDGSTYPENVKKVGFRTIAKWIEANL